jgi:hypothetical protein
MLRFVLATGLAVGIVAAAISAQAPAQRPGPEHARLSAFAGQWNYTGDAKASPLGPAGKVTSSETCAWFDGEFHLVCRATGTGPRGQVTGMSVMGYDPARHAYTYHAITSLGDNVFIRGRVDGKVWTWSDETTIDGKAVKIHVTVTEQTPSLYGVRVEASMDNGPTMLVEEGTSTKQP